MAAEFAGADAGSATAYRASDIMAAVTPQLVPYHMILYGKDKTLITFRLSLKFTGNLKILEPREAPPI